MDPELRSELAVLGIRTRDELAAMFGAVAAAGPPGVTGLGAANHPAPDPPRFSA